MNLLRKLRFGDEIIDRNFLRISATDLDYALEKISPLIRRRTSYYIHLATRVEGFLLSHIVTLLITSGRIIFLRNNFCRLRRESLILR